MKVLLVGVNSKFIHSNLAIYSIYEYCKDYGDLYIKEYTINNNTYDVLTEIYEEKANVVAFSSYIWNIEFILEVARELKKVSPNTKILLGGPEVSYGNIYLDKYSFIDYIIQGEGEEAFKSFLLNIDTDINKVNNLQYRIDDKIIKTPSCKLVDINEIPFIYDSLDVDLKNRIIYYETSRGCPYSCKFCLSSAIEGVRTLNINRVKSDLLYFLNLKVPQVKFVDRTFNFNKKTTYEIWDFLIQNDNGYTNFHFELSADLLTDDLINLIKKARIGLFQFEIGVQSTNTETLNSTNRVNKNSIIFENVKKVSSLKNIHQHLDLIVGLPFEDYNIFRNSFNEVYAMNPEKLQVGFLKLLYGTDLREKSKEHDMVFTEKAPYEILANKWLSFDDIIKLKGIDEMVDIFYNSGKFKLTLKYLTQMFATPFDLYEHLFNYYKENNFNMMLHKKITLYNFMYDFINHLKNANFKTALNLLKFDLYVNDNVKNIPEWIESNFDYTEIKNIKAEYQNNEFFINKYYSDYINEKGIIHKKHLLKMTNIDVFDFDIMEYINSNQIVECKTIIGFDYKNRDLYNEVMGYGHCKFFKMVKSND